MISRDKDGRISVGNNQLVASRLDNGQIQIIAPKRDMTPGEALLHAAWLVVLAEEQEGEFQQVLDAVRAT